MKKFTIKDFIAYNNPCFSCDRAINFEIGFLNLERRQESSLRPVVTKECTEIDLRITYSNSLKLKIVHKTNKLISSDIQALTDYLAEHKLFLMSTCDHCMTQIVSQFLDFNLLLGYVNAVGLAREHLMVNHDNKIYAISSSFIQERSLVTVTSLDRVKPLSPFSIETPLLPLYKLRTRERLIEKINTYMIFS